MGVSLVYGPITNATFKHKKVKRSENRRRVFVPQSEARKAHSPQWNRAMRQQKRAMKGLNKRYTPAELRAHGINPHSPIGVYTTQKNINHKVTRMRVAKGAAQRARRLSHPVQFQQRRAANRPKAMANAATKSMQLRRGNGRRRQRRDSRGRFA